MGALLLVLAGAARADPNSASLLFETPALIEVPTGTTLIYRLERTVAPGLGADAGGAGLVASVSTVELSLQPDPTDGRRAVIEIVTGERRQAAGTFPSLVGNPVLLVLLERDVAEMSRRLRGSPYYLRNRLREALGEATPAVPTRLNFSGRRVEGWRVAVSPFAQDRHRDKLGAHAAKRYEFTFSDAVPGGLYEIRLTTPDAQGATLVEDHLAFEGSQLPKGEAR
jgi:hypothetical protein